MYVVYYSLFYNHISILKKYCWNNHRVVGVAIVAIVNTPRVKTTAAISLFLFKIEGGMFCLWYALEESILLIISRTVSDVTCLNENDSWQKLFFLLLKY